MHFKHKGMAAQLLAESWLLIHGYEVFSNVSEFGPIDLIAVKLGEAPLLLDSKSTSFYPKATKDVVIVGFNPLKKEQLELGIKPIYVNLDTGVVDLDINKFLRKMERKVGLPCVEPSRKGPRARTALNHGPTDGRHRLHKQRA